MQLKKLSDAHYVVVSDEPIEVGNYIMNIERNHIYPSPVLNEDVEYRNKKSDVFKKITHSTQPLRGGYEFYYGSEGKINLQEVKELVGEVDIEKRIYDTDFRGDTNSYKQGYIQAIEDNKDKRFSEEDIQWAIHEARYHHEHSVEEIIQSLTQPKDTWEVKFINGKLKLK